MHFIIELLRTFLLISAVFIGTIFLIAFPCIVFMQLVERQTNILLALVLTGLVLAFEVSVVHVINLALGGR